MLNATQAQAEATAQAKADAMANPASANSSIALAYDDHEWTPAVLDSNTTEGIKNTLKAHAAAIQTLADHIDGVNKPIDSAKYVDRDTVAKQANQTNGNRAHR